MIGGLWKVKVKKSKFCRNLETASNHSPKKWPRKESGGKKNENNWTGKKIVVTKGTRNKFQTILRKFTEK